MVKNKERKSATISLTFVFISIIAGVLPFILEPEPEAWAFAEAFIALVVGLSSLLVFLMFQSRAKVLDRIFEGQNLLARFQYGEREWNRTVEGEIKDAGIGKIVGFFIGGIFLLIGFVLYLADPRDNGVFMLIMAGLCGFFIMIGFLSAAAAKKRIRGSLPEAVIAKDGLYYQNILYTWNNPTVSYLESVVLHPTQPGTLLFVLRQLSGGRSRIAHYHKHDIPIPIPRGCEVQAEGIVRYFNLPLKKDTLESTSE